MDTEDTPVKISTFVPVVILLLSIGFVATDLYLPSLPIIVKNLHTNITNVQLTLSLYLLCFGLSQLIFGPLSEKYGRRKIIYIGIFLSMPGTILAFLAPNVELLIVGRMIQGLGLGASAIVARSVFRDAFSGDRLAFYGSFLPIGYSFLMAVAPLLGGYIQFYSGWRADFIAIFLLVLIVLFLAWLWLPETLIKRNPNAMQAKTFFGNYTHLLKNFLFLGYCGCGSLNFIGFAAYFTATPFLLESVVGISPIMYGWSLFVIAFGLLFGGLVNAWLVKRIGRHRTLVVGVCTLTTSGILMLIPALFGIINTTVIVVPMVIFFFGSSLTFPQAFAGALHPFKKIAGFAAALYGCFQLVAATIGSGIISITHEKTQLPFGILLTLVGIGCYFLQRLAFKHYQKQRSN